MEEGIRIVIVKPQSGYQFQNTDIIANQDLCGDCNRDMGTFMENELTVYPR